MQDSATLYNFGFNIDIHTYAIITKTYFERFLITDKFFQPSDILRNFNFRKNIKTQMLDLYSNVFREFFQFF